MPGPTPEPFATTSWADFLVWSDIVGHIQSIRFLAAALGRFFRRIAYSTLYEHRATASGGNPRIAVLLGVIAAASSSLLIGCGDSSVTYFPSRIGQTWDMVADGTGDITHFEIVNAPTSDHADSVNMHITKTQARAYWEQGVAGAELWWGMHQLPDGRWVADYSIANFDPPNLMRFDYLHSDSNSYMVIPPSGAAAGDYYGYAQDTWCPGDSYCQIPWVKVMWLARISYPTVDTPVYKGPALLNEEYECAQPIDLSEINNPLKCAHELWYFAPNIGLVEIAPEWVALPCDPNCPPGTPIPPTPPAIRRIN